MSFSLEESIALLERTPRVLTAWLGGLPESWTTVNEGPETWSAYDIVGHLVHGEKTDWVPRIRIVFEHGAARAFEPFDRFAQERESVGKSMSDLLDEFAELRAARLGELLDLGLRPEDLARRGLHPELGEVTLEQLLAAWTVHDVGHLAQIARVMAKRYRDAVGPWSEYLPVVDSGPQPSD